MFQKIEKLKKHSFYVSTEKIISNLTSVTKNAENRLKFLNLEYHYKIDPQDCSFFPLTCHTHWLQAKKNKIRTKT